MTEQYGDDVEGWKRALRESAVHMVREGKIRGYRGKGIATQLLDRVCAGAKTEGYEFVEVYPTEQEQRSELAYTGPMHLYEKAGFTEFARRGNTVIMRKALK